MKKLLYAFIMLIVFFGLSFFSHRWASGEQQGDAWMGLRWNSSIEEAERVLGVDIISSQPPVMRYSHTVRGWRIANLAFQVGLNFENDELNFIQLTCISCSKDDFISFEEITMALSKKYGVPHVLDKSKGNDVVKKYTWHTKCSSIEANFLDFESIPASTMLFIIYNPITKPGDGL